MIQFETVGREVFNVDEIAKLGTLYSQCFGKPTWSGFVKDVFIRPNLLCFFASVDGERVGFRLGYDIGCFAWRSWLLGVKLEHRRKGIGGELIIRGNEVLRKRMYSRVTSNQTPEAKLVCERLGLLLRQKSSGEFLYMLEKDLM